MDIQTKKVNPLKKVEEKVKSIIGKNLAKINKQYSTSLQLARFSDLKAVEDLKIIMEAGLDKEEQDNQGLVYFINGALQPTDKQLFEKFTFLFIKMLDDKIDHKYYSLVYFVGDEIMSSGFTRFREFMKLLPVKYYVRLKQMYVYHASLLVRSFLFFENSKRGKLWKKRTRFIGEYIIVTMIINSLNDLFNVTIFHKRWIELVPEYFKDQIDMTHLNNLRSESIALNPINEANNTISIFGRELNSYNMNQMGIPEVLDNLLTYFSRQPERFHHQGLFRKSGSVSEQMQLAQLLSQGNYDALLIIDDINIVGDIIKKYFHSLATPLISFALYKTIVTNVPTLHENDSLDFISNIMDKMPILNRRVLSIMLSFLLDVVQYEDLNKMTSYNISVVFAPCLMWPQNQTTEEFLNIGLCIRFVSLMLKCYKTIFPGISYKIFLQNPEKSASTSGHSSAGIENQLSALLEEEQKDQQQFLQYSTTEKLIDSLNGVQFLGQFAKTEKKIDCQQSIMLQSTPNQNQRQKGQDSEEEVELEFTIDSILTNVKHNQPIQYRKKSRATRSSKHN